MNNTMKKVTKKANYNAIMDILNILEAENTDLQLGEDITYTSLKEFINHEIELLDNKTIAAQKRAAAKKIEGDALREKIYNVLSDTEAMLIGDIVKALDDPDISQQMVTARLTQLCAPEVHRAVKEVMTVPASTEGGKSKKLSAYRRISA